MTLKDALVSSSSTVGLRPVTVSAAESRDIGHPGICAGNVKLQHSNSVCCQAHPAVSERGKRIGYWNWHSTTLSDRREIKGDSNQ
jgi:hypothetical protein